MAGATSIGQHHHHLERLGGWCSKVLVVAALSLIVTSCSPRASASVAADLAAFVPANGKVTASSDRHSAAGRSAAASLTLGGSADEYVNAFKSAARAQGYEEQVDQTNATTRVVAYRAPGDKTITLTLTTNGTAASTAAIVLASP